MKRRAELHRLSEDHHHGLVLARRARMAGAGKQGLSYTRVWEEVERRFREELEPHFLIEEQYLVPPLQALGEAELIARLHSEHETLRASIRERSQRSAAALKGFGDLLERHIRFEERELFETAQQRLSGDDLRKIEQACRR